MSGSFEKRSMHTAVSKALMLVIAFVLVIGISVVGTLAWLTAQTPEVKNTFTSAELFANPASDFTLWEHQVMDENNDGRYELATTTTTTGNAYEILPGVNIPKDPTVEVNELEEHAYLYIKVTGNLPTGLTYSIDSGNWAELSGYSGVWVYKGTEAESNVIKATDAQKKTFKVNILTQNQDGTAITVGADYNGTADDLTLSFQAYMVQATGNGDSAAAAWANTYGETTE